MFSNFWLELNAYRNVVIEEEIIVLICKSNKCTFLNTFNIIREKIGSNNNFLCKYLI